MIDHVPPDPRRASFKPSKLCDDARTIEKRNISTVQFGQNVSIQIGSRSVGNAIRDAVARKCLTRPLTGIAVALDRGEVIALEQISEFVDDSFGAERRSLLARGVE